MACAGEGVLVGGGEVNCGPEKLTPSRRSCSTNFIRLLVEGGEGSGGGRGRGQAAGGWVLGEDGGSSGGAG